MSTNTHSAPRTDTAERAAAIGQSLLPIATGALAPMLDASAATAAAGVYLAGAAFVAANYMNRLGRWADDLPMRDIARAHRDTLGISTITTGMALGLGIAGGPEAADLLMAGALQPTTVPGILSLGWWAAVGLVPLKLRRVLGRKHTTTAPQPGTIPVNQGTANPVTSAGQIMAAWEAHISNPDNGQHKHQVLTDVRVYTQRWTGRIIAPAGASVNVTKQAVSSVYRVNAGWIDIEHGEHAGEALIAVSYSAPAELDPSTLQGAWKKRVACSGGAMPKTHLKDVTDDPNTGGKAAWVIADDDMKGALKSPDLTDLAGDLRKSPLLISYEPNPNNVRKAIIRVMDSNPLETGHEFQGLDSLKASAGGWFPIGKIISGHPARFQMFDPALGALHLVIAGTTGSGKGGAAQVVCLGYHANGAAMIYGDPKGASNPAIPKMAAYSGLHYGALGALRLSYHVLQHRVAEAARLELKNFQPSKMRPWVPTILDEAPQLLGPKVANRAEAVHIVKAGASLGRSMGMPWVLITQTVNLDQMGGEQAIRANLLAGGAWLILRTDSDQVNLGDLPAGFEGIDPSQIPAVWPSDDESLIYDPDMPENDPRRTFGLGYLAAPGGRAGMMRIDTLEDATPHIRPELIAAPEDVPWWGDEDVMEELANTPLPGFEEKGDGSDDEDGSGLVIAAGIDFQKKEPTAEEKVIAALRDDADPLHLDYLDGSGDIDEDDFEINYMKRPALLATTGMNESTFANTLKKLEATGKIHRITEGKTVRVGLGPGPQAGE